MNQLLPKTLKDMANMIGYEQVLQIVESYAGDVLYIPHQPTLDWALLPILGYENAYKLAKMYGGSQILIATCKRMKCEDRNEQIRRDRLTMTIGAIAHKYGISYSQVQKVCRA